ncbi:hypothetical protein [Pseudomonas sp. SW-3]|uniref:hypothetical protein n=1 Tax=Pseudomonas sp. SW-3 TaxID=147212 RepID=UPI003FA3ACAB
MGWSRSGTRPDFDLVTGVSTGALIAPLAFAGKYWDPRLIRGLPQCRCDAIDRARPGHAGATLALQW